MDTLLKHAAEKIYNGWDDWRLSILRSAVSLCSVPGARKKLEEQLSLIQEHEKGDGFYAQYILKECQNIQYTIIRRFDGEKAANKYIEQHLSNNDFRKIAITQALAENRFEWALKLCLDGEKADAQYPGLVSDWRRFRYTVYEKQNNAADQKELALLFILDGDFDYFPKLKKLCTPKK
jgi:hypothetical protein